MLARKSFEALPAGGRILLHEILMDDDGCGPLPAAAFSLLMLLGTRGRQYSLPELRQMLEAAGLAAVEVAANLVLPADPGRPAHSLMQARSPLDASRRVPESTRRLAGHFRTWPEPGPTRTTFCAH
jgi:acetylserotonin N-methyltransferase